MSCNCITEKQLDELFKKYGDKTDLKKLTFSEKVKFIGTKTGASIMMLVIMPFLFGYVVYKAYFSKDKKISLKRFFNLKERNFEDYVEQQRRKQ